MVAAVSVSSCFSRIYPTDFVSFFFVLLLRFAFHYCVLIFATTFCFLLLRVGFVFRVKVFVDHDSAIVK